MCASDWGDLEWCVVFAAGMRVDTVEIWLSTGVLLWRWCAHRGGCVPVSFRMCPAVDAVSFEAWLLELCCVVLVAAVALLVVVVVVVGWSGVS